MFTSTVEEAREGPPARVPGGKSDHMEDDRTPNPCPAPAPPPGYVERTRLDPLFRQGGGRLVRILAPAGYGKTSLAARWVADDDRHVRWMDVDRADNDPVTLLDTLRRGLTGIVDVPWPSAIHAGSGDPCVAALRSAFSAVRTDELIESFVVVLDDVHRLRDRAAVLLLAVLAEHIPSSATLVLVGRAHHDHGTIGRLRVTPGVIDVTVDELAFDESECCRLLDAMGIEACTPELARVVGLLDGWPAGLRLAGRAGLVEGAAPNATDLADDVALVDYLRAEWTDQLDRDDLEFLREAACLARVTGEMCDEVLGRTGSAQRLQRLHRHELVVFALDKRDRWYRLHPLLSRWLAGELRASDPHRWAEIHGNASRYWAAAGEIDLAVEHAQRAGDHEQCEALAVTYGGAYFTQGRDATVQSWLDAIPADRVRRSPGLCSLSVIKALHAGDDTRATQWLRLADEAVAGQSAADGRVDPSSQWTKVLHAAMDERPAAQLIPICKEGLEHLVGGPWAGFGWWVLAALQFLDGDSATAAKSVQVGLFEAELAGNPLVTAHCLATAAIIDDCSGDRSSAGERGLAATEALRACHAETLAPTAPAMAMGALIDAREGRRDEALQRAAAARRALEGFRSVAPWLNVLTRIALVRTTLLLDDRETSRALMRELEYHARVECSEGGAVDCIGELRDRVDAMHQPATGASALTNAELTVLHHLPTNLSLGQIADRLYVSRNTVKSHTAAIYRKLLAENRTEAVERARAAGLLDDQPFVPG